MVYFAVICVLLVIITFIKFLWESLRHLHHLLCRFLLDPAIAGATAIYLCNDALI